MVSKSRNGIVRHESVMKLRNKLEELGKMKGVNQDEKGGIIVFECLVVFSNWGTGFCLAVPASMISLS